MSNIDYDLFENNGLDDGSQLLQMFKQQNRRVKNIFRDDSEADREVFGVRQSHGLFLESIDSKTRVGGSTTSDKENAEGSSQHSSGHMRALSPKSVHEARLEEINEIPQRLVMSGRRDLRRSLFKAIDPRKIGPQDIICSTPVNDRRRPSVKQSLFTDDVNISPIRIGDNNKSQLVGISEIPQQTKTPSQPSKIQHFESIAMIDNDLREQYKITTEPKTPKRTLNKSFTSEPGRSPPKSISKRVRTTRGPSEPPAALTMGKLRQCSVRLEQMEMSEDFMRTYQQTQMRRLTTTQCNKTDVRPTYIQETPIVQSRKTRVQCDDELAKKLQVCESDYTSDEDEPEAIVPQSIKTPKNSFRKPATPRNIDNRSVASHDSSIHKVVSKNIMESFKDLPRRTTQNLTNATQSTSIASQSCRVNVVKKAKRTKSAAAEEYLKLTQVRKPQSKKGTQKKRTLYSQRDDDDDDDDSPQSSAIGSVKSKESVVVVYSNNLENIESATESEAENFPRPGPKCSKPKNTFYGNPPSLDEQFTTTAESIEGENVGNQIQETPKSRRSAKNTNYETQESEQTEESEEESTYQSPRKSQKSSRRQEELIDSDSEEEPVEKVTKKPKSRSVKKTYEVQQPSEYDDEESNIPNEQSEQYQRSSQEEIIEYEESEEEPVEIVKKKSDKKPKKSTKNATAENEELPKRLGRGRPRRNPVEEVDNDNNGSSDNTKPKKGTKKDLPKRLGRGRPRKDPVEEVDGDSNDSSSDDGSTSKKRKKPDYNIAEEEEEMPQRRRRRRADVDEGFDESIDSDIDVIYKPENERYKFRTRRYAKPWWITNAPKNMRVVRDVITNKDMKVDKQIKLIEKRTGINRAKACYGNEFAFPPALSEMLKTMKQIEKEKKGMRKFELLSKKNKHAKDKGGDDHETASIASGTSAQSNFTPSEAIHLAFQNLSNATGNGRTIHSTESYDIAQFDNIEWIVCNAGLHFYGFLGASGDGLIKLLPGGFKGKSRTKSAVLKMLVLCGEVTFIIENDVQTIKDFGFVNIHKDMVYEMKNTGDKDVILSFTRMNQSDFMATTVEKPDKKKKK